MSSPDPRYEGLANELRAAKPKAPPELRERVAALEPVIRKRWGFPRISARRVSLVLVPACLVAAVGAAVIHGVVTSGGRAGHHLSAVVLKNHRPTFKNPPGAGVPFRGVSGGSVQEAFAPSGRLQRYDVQLKLRVRNLDGLSNATKQAMQATRHFGGYVATVTYAAPTAKSGGASLVLMVPIDRVQDALQRFSSLGTILAQHVSIKDVQKQVDEETSGIAKLRRQIAGIRTALDHGSLSPEKRRLLERRLASDQRRLRALQGTKFATVRRASFAQIKLALVTKRTAAAHPGRLGRTFRDAASVLTREGEFVAYAVIVGGPLLLLGAAGIAGVRLTRRRNDERLLGRA
jgi:hypothetical protein